MKTLIIAINSKYVHTMLSARYLKASLPKAKILEININAPLFDVLSSVYSLKPDIVAVPVYIFNAEYVQKLLPEVKKLLPQSKIVLGGWEAAFNEQTYLPLCDYLLKGEGDFGFSRLVEDIKNGSTSERVIELGTVENLDDIKSPYDDEYALLGKEKILYFESSRGCPFNCAYCMSCLTSTVRAFSLERVKSDLNKLVKYNPKCVKFVDRTFNYNLNRANQIIEYIIENFSKQNTVFHFELAPELFDEKFFNTIKSARPGLLQFEIGVQSFNKHTLKAVNRVCHEDIVLGNISRLVDFKNCSVHVDLIAGLPEEDILSFISGFNKLMFVRPTCLQLGFLKILNGSKLADLKSDYVINSNPPYEVLASPKLHFDDVIRLKAVEELLDIYYNSGKFVSSISFLLDRINPFELFEGLAGFIVKKGYQLSCLSQVCKAQCLIDYSNNLLNPLDFEQLVLRVEQDYYNSGNNRRLPRRNTK